MSGLSHLDISDVQDRSEHGMTKRTYVEAVLEGMRQYREAASQSPGATMSGENSIIQQR